MEHIIERLDKSIVEVTEDVTPLDINDNSDLIDDLNFNSINIISLVISLETEFDIEIPDDFLILEKLRSYRQIKELIISLVKAKELTIDNGEQNE